VVVFPHFGIVRVTDAAFENAEDTLPLSDRRLAVQMKQLNEEKTFRSQPHNGSIVLNAKLPCQTFLGRVENQFVLAV
jgi:hypothetical protein